jgi:hypothetical protein
MKALNITMNTKAIRTLAALVAAITLIGCTTVLAPARLEEFPKNPISPEQAIKRAEPYLDRTYELRKQGSRLHRQDKDATVHVSLKGNYYYIVKESYPAIYIDFYLPHAVKVHKVTGDIIPPR